MLPKLLDAVARGALAAAPGFLPARASSAAASIDGILAVLFWVSAAFLGLILFLVVLFVVRYRMRASRPEPEPSPAQATSLELLWTFVPLAIVLVLFAVSARAYVEVVQPQAPAGALQIQVTARRWSWWFDHPGGKGAGELHLVAGRPAELVMVSSDVVHSLYVPEFRLKQDVVPGRFARMVVTPTVAGTYPVLCAEFCGTDHSRMLSQVVVHPDQGSFDAWAREGAAPAASLVDLGRQVCAAKGCIACHSDDGTPRVGPTFKGLWGKQEQLADGTAVRVDEDYLRESILKPSAKVVKGFPPVMPPVPLEERELQGVVAYLRSLGSTP